MLKATKNQEKKTHEYNKKIFFINRTVTTARDYKKIKESTKRERTTFVSDAIQPTFYRVLFENIVCKKACFENQLFYKGKLKYWMISEVKLAKMLDVSKTTARKLLNRAEIEGIITRGYLYETHKLGESMGIAVTSKGKKLLKELFTETRKTTKSYNSIPTEYNYNNNYKSAQPHEITFKNRDDSITAEAIKCYQKTTGRYTERITAAKCKYIHHAINTLSKAFYASSTEQKIGMIRQFIKHQVEYLRNATFSIMFSLKALWAYIYKLRKEITLREQEAQESKQQYAGYKVLYAEKKAETYAENEKQPENQSFSSSPNVFIVPNTERAATGLRSAFDAMNDLLKKMQISPSN